MRPWKSRAGQIVIPAMLLFPTLFLFVYLIYETAKLSREKINHQFAMDAAAFVEATNYSDFLNRTAYVNGAFPMRIFEQGYDDFPADCESKVEHCEKISYAEVLYQNGIFPRSRSRGTGTGDPTLFTDEPVWDIEYGGVGVSKNSSDPEMPDPVVLFSLDNANKYWHPWDLATEVYKLYVQVYSLLGSVEDAQWQVLKRLTKDSKHSFLQKSYWLNTGDAKGYGDELANSFDAALGDFKTRAHCVRKLVYNGNRHLGGSGIQQYRVYGTDPPIDLPDSPGTSPEGCGPGGGLFQIADRRQGDPRRPQQGRLRRVSRTVSDLALADPGQELFQRGLRQHAPVFPRQFAPNCTRPYRLAPTTRTRRSGRTRRPSSR